MTNTLSELEAKLAYYRQHDCSYDEHEAGCPVCGDIEQIEHELSRLQDAWPSGTSYPDTAHKSENRQPGAVKDSRQ
jgi:hypothetical protein